MRERIWPSVSLAFAVLLLLVPFFAWLVSRQAAKIDSQTRRAHAQYQAADDAITEVRANIYKSALLTRNFPAGTPKPSTLDRITTLRRATAQQFQRLSSLLDRTQHTQLIALKSGLDEYWNSIASAGVTPDLQLSSHSLIEQSRELIKLAEQIDTLNESNLSLEERQIEAQQRSLWHFAAGATGLLLLLGLTIAVVSTAYLANLERVSEREKTRAERAEYELRRLSNQLVRIQEDERRTISRELHDEVGQILTGLRMELGTLSRASGDGSFRQRLDSIKQLAEDALRSVRNLALLLRPSMLDDLGLEPALRWQAKEFSRRTTIPVSLQIEGQVNSLPEGVSLCLYRAVQEALTNCAKHAEATRVTISVKQAEDLVLASVNDNGKGFDSRRLRSEGLGLLGMEERVRALQGQFKIESRPGEGTVVNLILPLTARLSASNN